MSRKILVIEDSPTDAAIIEELLDSEGLEVNVAFTGKEGLKKCLEMKPDLVILDLMLPDMDGIEVCRLVRKEESLSGTIIVILSALKAPQKITEALDGGADDYIIKLSNSEFLVKKIKLYLGIRK